jgi:tubulin-specific chaperone D
MYNALISGLDDYTVDERGDVGSWIRIASIQGLTSVFVTLLTLAKTDATHIDYIPAGLYQKAIAGILKQGVGRLDNVRQQAGESILCLLKCPLPSMGDTNPWKFHGEELFIELLPRYPTGKIFSDVFLTLFKVKLLLRTTVFARTVGRTALGYFQKQCAF